MQKYKDVLPCGILQADDRVYWLLRPEPVQPDSWQHLGQQRFVVVPFEPECRQIDQGYDEDGKFYSFLIYDYARHLICTNPIIEYRNITEPIKVIQLDEEYIQPEPAHEPEPEPEDLRFAEEMFLKDVGAMQMYEDEDKHALDFLDEQYGY